MLAKRKKSRLTNKRLEMAKKSKIIQHELLGILVVGVSCLMLVTIFSQQNGVVGGQVSRLLEMISGEGRALIPIMIGAWGFAIMQRKHSPLGWRAVGAVLLWLVIVGLLHFQLPDMANLSSATLWSEGKAGKGGGLAGAAVAVALRTMVGVLGSYIVLTFGALLGVLLVINRSLMTGLEQVKYAGVNGGIGLKKVIGDLAYTVKEQGTAKNTEEPGEYNLKKRKVSNIKKNSEGLNRRQAEETDLPQQPVIIESFTDRMDIDENKQSIEPKEVLPSRMTGNSGAGTMPAPGKVTGTPISRQVKKEINEAYQLPPLSVLQKSLKMRNARINKDLADNVRILEETLDSFGVKVKVTHVTQGPAITRYEAQPAPGIKVSKITNLADDIALSLAASDVRIEAPVPGKSVVGIEVPNKEIAMVHLREVLESTEFADAPSKLSLALGKDITGTPVIADLTKMPHLLIAGATGSGKSVCINTIINSVLFKAKPEEVKFLLIDPKMVELANYNGIPHLLSPVVTDSKKAAGALKWIVTEMETRYELFAAAGVRDIIRYNYLRNQEKEEARPSLPYVVVIIDELADLMMVAPGDVEDSICRIAQMARAAGIHLVVATQRPSVDVITGLIKANIPSRIAFAVSSQTDSRTILDGNGAEKLLGRGDMLYYPMGASKALRVQGCYLADKEVENIVGFLQQQAKPEYQEIPQMELGTVQTEQIVDELFYQAGLLFIETGNASVSLLQRRFRIGYTRAARLMDNFEEKGVVGGYEGSKPRDVLMSAGQFEQKFGLNQP